MQVFFANVKTNKYVIHLSESVAMALKPVEVMLVCSGFSTPFSLETLCSCSQGSSQTPRCRMREMVDSSILGAFQLKSAAFLEEVH